MVVEVAGGVAEGGFPVHLDAPDIFGLAHFAPEEQVALLEIHGDGLPQGIVLQTTQVLPAGQEDVVIAFETEGSECYRPCSRPGYPCGRSS